MSRIKVQTAKDGRQYAEVTEFSSSSLNGVAVKLYIKSSADNKYYQLDISAGPTLVMTDRGSTAPTDGLIVTGG